MFHSNIWYLNLLVQNKYYVIPSLNVDGVAFIENYYQKTGHVIGKRTNLNIRDKKCSKAKGGVDLNRNFPYNFA